MRVNVLLVAAIAVLLVAPALAKNVKVCKGAKPAGNSHNAAGGWILLSPKDIKKDQDLQNNANQVAQQKATAKNCTVKKVTILNACSQVVAGINYQYNAETQLKCGKKIVPSTFNNTFLVPPTGK